MGYYKSIYNTFTLFLYFPVLIHVLSHDKCMPLHTLYMLSWQRWSAFCALQCCLSIHDLIPSCRHCESDVHCIGTQMCVVRDTGVVNVDNLYFWLNIFSIYNKTQTFRPTSFSSQVFLTKIIHIFQTMITNCYIYNI